MCRCVKVRYASEERIEEIAIGRELRLRFRVNWPLSRTDAEEFSVLRPGVGDVLLIAPDRPVGIGDVLPQPEEEPLRHGIDSRTLVGETCSSRQRLLLVLNLARLLYGVYCDVRAGPSPRSRLGTCAGRTGPAVVIQSLTRSNLRVRVFPH